jgi:hypothetical protein
MRANRWVRTGLLAVILAFCCYGLAKEWPQVRPALGRVPVYSLAGSFAAALLGAACMMLAWRSVLADMGSPLPASVTGRVTFVSQLGKYVPGAVWSFAAHVELGHDYKVPRARGAASVLVSMAIAMAVGLLLAAIGLPLSSPAMAHRYLPAIAAIPVIAVCLAPPVLCRLLNVALRLIRQEPLERPVSWRGFGSALAWTVLGWLLFGLQAWLLLIDVAGHAPGLVLLALGGYAFATSMALLLVVFPGGIVAREVLFVAALAPVLAHGPALAVALVARIISTASDLTWGAVALTLGKRLAPAPQSAAVRQRGRHRKPVVRPWPARNVPGQLAARASSGPPA